MTDILTPEEYEDIKARPTKVHEDVERLEATVDAMWMFAKAAVKLDAAYSDMRHLHAGEYAAARKVLVDNGWLT